MITRYKTSKDKRTARIRSKVRGRVDRPRLSVFKSNRKIYAQVIDDAAGKTLAAAMGVDPTKVGLEVAGKAVKAGISKIVFDRGAYSYHGQVKALATAARTAGLFF